MSHSPGALITGGAGFVGTNLADRLASNGTKVTVLDNLRRPGVEENLRWLMRRHRDMVRFVQGDVRDPDAVAGAMQDAACVFHLAAQVAVTFAICVPLERWRPVERWPDQKAVLARAARLRQTSLSEFMLSHAYAAAQEVLAEQLDIVLPPAEWQAFCKALDAPPRVIPALRKLLTEAIVFDGQRNAAAP